MPVLEELLHLDLPAQPGYVAVARSVVTSAAAGLEGLDAERLDDLRLAVSEACTSVVALGTVDRVVIRCRHDESTLEVSIEDHGPISPRARLDGGNDLALQLLTALVDDLVLEGDENGNAIRLRLALHASGAELDA
jgi:anti-sigma regulatory factor (Ser/Thr protein kinase)